MKTLYIECNMGAAGDMLMAALLELLPDKENFLNKINSMGLKGVKVEAEKSVRCGITGTRIIVKIGDGSNAKEESSIDVDLNAEKPEHHDHHEHDHEHNHEHDHEHGHKHEHEHEHEHEHHHSHSHRSLGDVEAVIYGLNVSEGVKKNALEIYKLISEAEAHVHGCPAGEIHFHEVGSLDAIADIVGVCLLIEELAPDKIAASPVNTGSGFVRCSHGILPVPAPATAFLLSGIPVYSGNIKAELCTPTGAALLKHFAGTFGPMPEMTICKTGYGMGKKDFKAANCVRVFLGEGTCKADTETSDQIAELSCNIDDMTGEALGFACQSLLAAGAKDAFSAAIQMKKDRPGQMLTCICDAKKADSFAELMFKHTSTFGIRKKILSRYILGRSTEVKKTPLGDVRVKTGKGYGVIKNKLEYDDVAELAKKNNCSIMEMEYKLWKNLKN